MISLSHIDVVFNKGTALEKQALYDVNLEIDRGSFVTVIGSNGAGKSTLLSILAGDVLPNSGKVSISGQDVSRQRTVERANHVARVFQDPLAGSCTDLTIEENLALAAARGHKRGLGFALKKQRRQLFRDRIAQLGIGLEDRLQQPMGSLSGGQRQAVSLIMASLNKSDILLLDEHTAALDPGMAEFIMNLTADIVRDTGLTTLMVTHSMRQAIDYGDRLVMLHEGRIIFDMSGPERASLGVDDLLNKFRQVRGEVLDDDALLMD